MTTLYTIKPLEWEQREDTDWRQSFEAQVPSGDYTLRRVVMPGSVWSPWKLRWCYCNGLDEWSVEVGSLEDGKRRAWHDWLSRITPALEEVAQVKDEDVR